MDIKQYLSLEFVPALGCTEPAAIAYAAMNAAKVIASEAKEVRLTVDPKIYKNCYSVGIPHSSHKNGIVWAVAIGCFLHDTAAELQCFQEIDEEAILKAGRLVDGGKITVEIDRGRSNIYIDVTVTDGKHSGQCIIEDCHTNITIIKADGKVVSKKDDKKKDVNLQHEARLWAAGLSDKEIVSIARGMNAECRKIIRDGAMMNLKMARHGISLFPKLALANPGDPLTKISAHVSAGVYARMSGEDLPVTTVAGSGNKGIVCTVPLIMLEEEWKLPKERVEEAIAIAAIFTSKTTEELGTLSAVCGCSNAAGIGLSCALVYLKDGGMNEVSYAISNMVGNVTGMICDGAKIGCALKTMTAVDAAFRSATLALGGLRIPEEDGIVGATGQSSLKNMGKIAKFGMVKTDEEILKIMERKLRK
jgi:L-cysteine desulfidase